MDTNVIVSATATRGLCADMFREVLLSHELIVSEPLLTEVSRVLTAKFGASAEMIESVIRILKQDTIFSQPLDPPDVTINDRDDLLILASALTGRAEVLVTGDSELLTLSSIYKLEIISPRQFWEKIVGQQPG
ncbi:MAG: putative toxin-antitoxin system toxin component, PIN family [Desulfobacterales bacterium]|nr:putative toxin-antitoxin system toxin component, PIN family [Desulfobacterales bacterium]